jgi:hypothetical protein
VGTKRRMTSPARSASQIVAHLIVVILPFLLALQLPPHHSLASSNEGDRQAMCSQPNDPEAKVASEKYHTPLAGEPFHLEFMGRSIDIPSRNRGDESSLELGGSVYVPSMVDLTIIPDFALYIRRTWQRSRLRLVASGVNDDFEYSKNFGDFEFLGRFENFTDPFKETGFENNEQINGSSVRWGTLSGFIGAGLRYPVYPYQVDNDLKLQILGRVGYQYAMRTDDSAPSAKLPPDTMLLGVKFRGRYDGIRRNLMELPHQGTAAGFDADFIHREHWADYGNRIVTFKKKDSRDYSILSGYVLTAFGIPGLSEKNRVVASLHAGWIDNKRADRYNAFRLDGGPFAQESEDTARPNYPGALHVYTLFSRYLMTNLEYRREIFPFLYLHLRGTFTWADRSTIVAFNQIGFKDDSGQTASIAVTTGFFWNSQLFAQYSWDTGLLRNGKPGSCLNLLWSKSF